MLRKFNTAGWIDVTWDHGGANSYRMGAEGRYDLQLADNETAAATATTATTPQEEGQSSVQNEQQQQEVWLKCTHEKFYLHICTLTCS